MRLMLLLQQLSYGGAEMHIVELARGLARRGHEVTVVTFYDRNPLGAGLAEAGVRLVSLQKRGRWEILRFLLRFLREVRRSRPHVIHTLMPVPNLVALSSRLAKRDVRIVWGIVVASLDLSHYDRLTRMSYALEARFAPWADLIISNSNSAVEASVKLGYPRAKLRMIPNGVDTERYRPDPAARAELRREWCIPEGTPLVGMVARLDPQKDIPTFLAAVARLAANPQLRIAVIGSGPEDYRSSLVAQADELGLRGLLSWHPARGDIEKVYVALDVLVESSTAAGTSYVVVQAMSCGTAVVVTDSGDNAEAVGPWGLVVPPRNPAALADAIGRQLERVAAEGASLAAACRRHIIESFSVDALVERTEAMFSSLVAPIGGEGAGHYRP